MSVCLSVCLSTCQKKYPLSIRNFDSAFGGCRLIRKKPVPSIVSQATSLSKRERVWSARVHQVVTTPRSLASNPGLLPLPRAHAPCVLIMRRWFFGGRRPGFEAKDPGVTNQIRYFVMTSFYHVKFTFRARAPVEGAGRMHVTRALIAFLCHNSMYTS